MAESFQGKISVQKRLKVRSPTPPNLGGNIVIIFILFSSGLLVSVLGFGFEFLC